jgi:hypothetical protein
MPDAGYRGFVVSFVVNLVVSSTRIPTKFAIRFTTKNEEFQMPPRLGGRKQNQPLEHEFTSKIFLSNVKCQVSNPSLPSPKCQMSGSSFVVRTSLFHALQSGRCLLPSGIPEYGSRQFSRIGFVLA